MNKLALANIGSLLVLIGLYLFPAGQDIVVLSLTNMLGSQIAAWTALYFICFGLFFVGWMLGGHKLLVRQFSAILKTLIANPVLAAGIIIFFFIFLNVYGGIG